MRPGKIIFLSLFSIFLFGIISLLGGYGGHHLKFLAASVLYFAFTYIFIKKARNRNEKIVVIIILMLPPALIYIPIHIMDFKDTLLSFPSTLAHFTGICFAILLISIHSKKVRLLLISLYLLACMWVAFIGYSKWIHKINFNTFSDNVDYPIPVSITGRNQLNQMITPETLEGKIVVLDFWNTRCGACFQKFPQLQDIYDKYKQTTTIKILAVDKPFSEDTLNQAFKMLAIRNYTFPILLPDDINLPEKFGVESYPTTIIINQMGKVVFNGDIENCAPVIEGLLSR